MWQKKLTEHAAECFFGDEYIFNGLIRKLEATPNDSEPNFWAQLQTLAYDLLVEGIEHRFSRQYRLTDIRQLIGRVWGGDLFMTPELPWLQELQLKMLQRNGDLLCYAEGELQAYVRLASGLDPNLLASWHFAQWIDESPQPSLADIRRVLNAQTTFFAPPGNSSLPFADGHVHWGGVTVDSVILEKYLLSGQTPKKQGSGFWHQEQTKSLLPLLIRARHLLCALLVSKTDPEGKKLWVGGGVFTHSAIDTQKNLPDWGLLAKRCNLDVDGSVDWLLGEFANVMQHGLPNRWLWLNVYLCALYRAKDTQALQRVAILCFWQTVNIVRRSLIMDGQGLTRFVERYNQPALGRPDDVASIAQRIWTAKSDLAEFKASPSAFNSGGVKMLAGTLMGIAGLSQPKPPYIFGEHEMLLDANVLAGMKVLERWHFCGHFSRSVSHRQRGRARLPVANEIWQQANQVMNGLQKISGWDGVEFFGGVQNKQFRFQPIRWFRGLDVAGDENALKIEWFAPALRWMRNGFKQLPACHAAGTGFHFSIHAGEDYAHPASGMRHVDETVRFCEMREGDRLGHALALGIPPQIWAERQTEMLLPLDEHLDNLVWLWHYASLLSGRLPLAQQVLPILSRRIARFWRESRWWQEPDHMGGEGSRGDSASFEQSALRHVTPEELFSAWLLRRNCHYYSRQIDLEFPMLAKAYIALPDHLQLTDSNAIATKLYFARHAWLATGEEERLVIVRLGDEGRAQANVNQRRSDDLLEDVETPAELAFMHALQDWLLTEYDQKGLIIEANPTSNVYIARLKSHAEHPIFRWHPPDESVLQKEAPANLHGLRRGPVRVLVNTDDPGIMPTTLRTEFLLLREAALELNIGRTVAERWLESLRQYGVEQFHRNHLPVFESA
ncbi:antiviral RADAR system adenosine deaminase RdrB [Undibacterium squillarum]|uniref:antiviral RADAR system adenosine deaminase RdrB n=1 Tax=Undibacterium squillarum TaxID=1131567 RepID=UPI0035B23C2A